ncbi:hypothetical protein V5P93_002384 [Actinokineospora auranticolor]|uniref:Plasmid replication, integration and excision activator n=1 Tax=Actinokineospora auranticolor TaxID=155976 RepID=A0A2S6GBZ3_9PSEU|nr:hypothetical protein [Actinokineospora auranticolor]PPK61879.1 hypothetical protein CLV40_13828 [Actinokineospora auranticolor]
MGISKGHRFPVQFADAFPLGLVLVGEVSPDTEYQSREDRAAGRPVRQRVDETTGQRQWKATVTDPSESNAKRASFEVTFLADVQPVPTTQEALPGMRGVELVGLTAEPRVSGTGEFKYQSYVYRATGFAEVASVGGTRGGAKSAGESSGKAA